MPRSTTPPVTPAHNSFILAEDEAVKLMLENCVHVPNGQGVETPVRVWYRFPEPETAITYPFVTIDLVGIVPAQDLWESEYRLYRNSFEEIGPDGRETGTKRIYDPSTTPALNPADTYFFWRRNYLAYRLFYQLTMWANNSFHDRIMSARMFRDIIKPHPSWLHCPADQMWKRLETINWAAADLPSQEGGSKRIFRKIYTISVQTEIPQDRLDYLSKSPYIQKVLLRGFFQGSDPTDYWTGDQTTDFWETLHTREEPPT